jgi:flagellar hook-basal body complex protein FliE
MVDSSKINSILTGQFPILGIEQKGKAVEDAPAGFADLLAKGINNVQSLAEESDRMSIDLALGKPVELHQVMLAATKAQIALELLLELRNKVIEAYQEVSRMPV